MKNCRARVVSRRDILKTGAALTAAACLPESTRSEARTLMQSTKHVAIIGAGAFGGWTALHLLRLGARVSLFDTWGPGHSRASSGGETRVIRATHGPERPYMELVRRSLELWRASEAKWDRPLLRPVGVLWLPGPDDGYERAALGLLAEYGFSFEELAAPELARRFPQINFEGVKWAILEKGTGYLLARRACQAVLEAFQAEGGSFRLMGTRPGPLRDGKMTHLALGDETKLEADAYVFACGPWLGTLFPEVIGDRVRPTRQEIHFFGTPATPHRFHEDDMPVWIDNGPRLFYGIPGSEWRGFKIADDTLGPPFDPTSGERIPSKEGIAAARRYLRFRFPGLGDAPLTESRVCQYENSPDGHFIIDRHPGAENVWLLGGGSGRGFKHGPALGERVARLVLGDERPDPFFGLARFEKAKPSAD